MFCKEHFPLLQLKRISYLSMLPTRCQVTWTVMRTNAPHLAPRHLPLLLYGGKLSPFCLWSWDWPKLAVSLSVSSTGALTQCQCFWSPIPSLDLGTRCLPDPPRAKAAVTPGPFKAFWVVETPHWENSVNLLNVGWPDLWKIGVLFPSNWKLETSLMWVWCIRRPGFCSS